LRFFNNVKNRISPSFPLRCFLAPANVCTFRMSRPFPADALNGALPSGESRGMQQIRPNLAAKRELDAPRANPVSVDLGNVLASKIMGSSFAGNRSSVSEIAQSLPGSLGQSMSVVDTGYSTQDQQTGEVITTPLVIRPWFQDGWERTFIEGTTLFTNLAEPWTGNAKGMHAAASVPILNYFSERAARTAAAERKNAGRGAGRAVVRAHGRVNVDDYSARDAQDFDRKWALAGTMTSDMKSNTSMRSRERMIGVAAYGRVPKVFNMFGENVRPGERLYFVTKRYPAASSSYVAPDGTTQAQYTSFPEPFLQTRGATDSGYGFIPHCTQHPGSVSGAHGGPREPDRDSVDFERTLAQEYREYEWDEENDTFMSVVRDIAAEEGQQEAVNSAPQFAYEAYEEGSVKFVGVAKTLTGHAPSAKGLSEAHRDINRMVKLQTVEVWGGV